MKFATSAATSVGSAALLAALAVAAPAPERRQTSANPGFYNPTTNGGSMLTGATASGLGEPINIIVSGDSDAGVLSEAGFEEFSRSLYYSPGSCFSLTAGAPQTANLGDGNGARNQTDLMRYNFKQGDGGTCLESLNGGTHFRYWIQNGTAADSGAIFMAASVELNATLNHDIAPNGYNAGRDQIVGNATAGTLTSPGGFQYTVTQQSNTQLLEGITTAQINHNVAVDGIVSILTVKITRNGTIGANENSNSSGSSSTSTPSSAASSIAPLSGGHVTYAALATLLWTSGLFILA